MLCQITLVYGLNIWNTAVEYLSIPHLNVTSEVNDHLIMIILLHSFCCIVTNNLESLTVYCKLR